MNRPAVILLAHGSPDPGACAELLYLQQRVAERLDHPVGIGVLEFASEHLPGLEDLFATVPQGSHVAAQPLVLFEGRHGRQDIPDIVTGEAQRGKFEVSLGSPLGSDAALIDIALERVRAASPSNADVLLFVGRGSSEPGALRQTERVAATIAGVVRSAHHVCYAGISRPTLAEGMAAVLRGRPRRVIALPYLLHTGVLVRRVSEVLTPVAARAGVELLVLPHIGASPALVPLVSSRLRGLL